MEKGEVLLHLKYYEPVYNIRKTCPCNAYPHKPQFHIVKLGYAGVYLFFLIFAPKHRLWVLVRTAYHVPTIYVLSKKKEKQPKNSIIFFFFFFFFFFLQLKKSLYIAWACIRNEKISPPGQTRLDHLPNDGPVLKLGKSWSFCSWCVLSENVLLHYMYFLSHLVSMVGVHKSRMCYRQVASNAILPCPTRSQAISVVPYVEIQKCR